MTTIMDLTQLSTFEGGMVLLIIGSILSLMFGYLFGMFPFGLILTRWMGHGDIRNIGSGNIGATNVLRTGSTKLALLTLLLDGLKGFLPVFLLSLYYPIPIVQSVVGLGAVLGHMFPIALQFKGGKGVATYLGVILAIAPKLGAIALGVWVLVAAITRRSSMASILCVSSIWVIFMIEQPESNGWIILAITSLLVVGRHHENIKRLIRGTEPKIQFRKSSTP